MTAALVLTPDQHEAFKRWGVLRLPGLLGVDVVRRAKAHVLRQLDAAGVSETAGWRLPDRYNGRKTSQAAGDDHPEIAALEKEPLLLAMVNELLDFQPLDRTAYPHPWVLFTPPNVSARPTWHVDAHRLPSGHGLGVQMFAFLDTVTPGGGGTLMVAGSHRLLNDGRYIPMKEVGGVLRQEHFFRRLYSASADEQAGVMAAPCLVNGVEQKVVELTGEPGDVCLVDVRVLHSRAPNVTNRPRMMVTQRFFRADLMQELRDILAERRKVASEAAPSAP